MTNLVDGQPENFIIDKCDFCGTEFYHVMSECAECGNKILTSTKVNEAAYREKFAAQVKDILADKAV